MPRKSLAPAFIVVNYFTTVGTIVMPHTMTVPVNVVVWNGGSTNVVLKDGSNRLWTTAILDLLTTIAPMYHTTSTFPTWELWRQDTATSDPVLVATSSSALIGGSASLSVLGSGANMAFRSTEDSAYRLLLLESNQAADQRKAYSVLSATQKAPIDYLLGNTSLVYARSNAYLNTFGLYTSKTYDKLRKKRLGM